MIQESKVNNSTYTDVLITKPVAPNFNAIPGAYFLGRWFEQTVNGQSLVSTITEGSSFFCEFDGPNLVIDFEVLQTMCIIAVSVDHQAYRKLPATSHCVISQTLASGHHEVRVVIDAIKEDDDLWFGGKGLAVKAILAEHVRPVRPTNKVAWFLGDSITAGIHVNGDPEPETNSYIQSYSNVASSELKLTNIPIAFGATGVTTGGSGDVPKAIDYLNQAMAGMAVTCDQPDLCVVNYGTNDRTQREAFPEAFKGFMAVLVAQVPVATPIVVLRPFVGDFDAEIKAIVATIPQAVYVDTQNWQFELTDGLHPNAVGSKKLGLYLAQKLLSVFGPSYFDASEDI